jgi:hypothetical protein
MAVREYHLRHTRMLAGGLPQCSPKGTRRVGPVGETVATRPEKVIEDDIQAAASHEVALELAPGLEPPALIVCAC